MKLHMIRNQMFSIQTVRSDTSTTIVVTGLPVPDFDRGCIANRVLYVLYCYLAVMLCAHPTTAQEKSTVAVNEAGAGSSLMPARVEQLNKSRQLLVASTALIKEKKYSEAKEKSLECLQIRTEILGATHLDTALPHALLAQLYRETGEYVNARDHYVQVLKIREKVNEPAALASRASP